MRKLIKVLFNLIMFSVLWWLQSLIILGISVGIGFWDPSKGIGGTPGIVGLISLYTSYKILKQIQQIKSIKDFFNRN